MKRTIGSASAKAILFGEHAVVYQRPAIAVPLPSLRATAWIKAAPDGISIDSVDYGRRYRLDENDHGPVGTMLRAAVRNTLAYLEAEEGRGLRIRVSSQVPIARGLGSGAAVSAAIARGLARYYDRELTPEELSALVYETEIILHGTPSGIDNSVVSFERPIWFRAGAIRPLQVGRSFQLVVGDTGQPSLTRETVAAVRAGWQADPEDYERRLDAIASAVTRARKALEGGDVHRLGRLMDENHALLQALEVSSPELDALVEVAREAGALGAKLSGGGRGGCMIALATEETKETVAAALQKAGGASVYTSTIRSQPA